MHWCCMYWAGMLYVLGRCVACMDWCVLCTGLILYCMAIARVMGGGGGGLMGSNDLPVVHPQLCLLGLEPRLAIGLSK